MNSKPKALLVLWPTSKCNLNCKYCYATAAKDKCDMHIDTAKRAVDYFKDCKLKIQFAGGEPLLNFKLIQQLYEYISEQNYEVTFQLQTNGTLITDEIAKELKRMNISLGVSMDGAPDINESLRGKTDALTQGMRHLANEGVTVNLNSVVTAQNVDRLSEMADVALYFGNVAGIGLDLLRNAGSAEHNKNIVYATSSQSLIEGVTSLYKRCELLNRLTGKRLYVRSVKEAKLRLISSDCSCNKNYCFASMGRSFVILPNGDSYPCGSLIGNTDYYMGNIMKDTKLREISIKPKSQLGCSSCEYYAYCSGGCPSRLLVNNIQNIETSLDCTLKKISFKLAKTERYTL